MHDRIARFGVRLPEAQGGEGDGREPGAEGGDEFLEGMRANPPGGLKRCASPGFRKDRAGFAWLRAPPRRQRAADHGLDVPGLHLLVEELRFTQPLLRDADASSSALALARLARTSARPGRTGKSG